MKIWLFWRIKVSGEESFPGTFCYGWFRGSPCPCECRRKRLKEAGDASRKAKFSTGDPACPKEANREPGSRDPLPGGMPDRGMAGLGSAYGSCLPKSSPAKKPSAVKAAPAAGSFLMESRRAGRSGFPPRKCRDAQIQPG
ncbi:hypothetical protein B4135_4036 [Caldibacillus debilis]|uniref:Uncharacterized protein n=1 Tax=Caldibacillus debilis TaxID=301148 RepID=A0A150L7S7_9BACI|nr:hypothetical protein B4135_4036 [Caldibacillus debilis]